MHSITYNQYKIEINYFNFNLKMKEIHKALEFLKSKVVK